MSRMAALSHRLFPHRQFYLRSRGSVQFFEFTPAFQMTVAIATMFILVWVAYSSVVVIFKEQIIATKDQRYASMQAAYEGRVSQMQLAYDELNGLLVLAEERFQNATKDLESKHRQLTALLMQKQAMDKSVRDVRRQVADMGAYMGPSYSRPESPDGANTLVVQLAEAEPALRQSRGQDTIADSTIAVVASAVRQPAGGGIPGKSALGKNYVVQRIAGLEDRLNTVKKQQLALLGELRDSAGVQIDKYARIVTMTGLNVDQVAHQVGTRAYTGRGGPLISEVRAAAIDGVTDEIGRASCRERV